MPTSPPQPHPDMVHVLWTAATGAVTQNPLIATLLGLMLLVGLARSARTAMHTGPRDPVRLFTRGDKRILLERAGNRCEHPLLFGQRCAATERLEADHVHPHSRGGWTHVSNGQILCQRHNREKSAAIPWDRSLRKLAERRATYYPPPLDGAVVRRQPRASKAGGRHTRPSSTAVD